jgi:hypothetical protein
MQMKINWFSRADKESLATIYPTNITINKPGSEKLISAYAAYIGIDKADKIVAIKPISKDQYDGGGLDKEMVFILSGGKTYTRVSSTDFVNKISEFIHCDFSKGPKKYSCQFNDSEGYLEIDLKKEVK